MLLPASRAWVNDTMGDEDKPKNRRERRAAAKESGKPVEPASTTPKIKMAQPDRSRPNGKTLLDIYEEKKELLAQGQPFDKKYEDGLARGESGNILEAGLGDGEPIGPIGNAIFWSVCLTMFHFTLDVLVYHQYSQEVYWDAIFKRSGTILPILFLVIYMMRSDLAMRFATARQLLFFATAVTAGCYLIHAGNNFDYFAVMKQAPPLGALWVYSVIELNLPFAAASLLVDIGYLWYNGYSAF